jgi:ankyrin repeat protein
MIRSAARLQGLDAMRAEGRKEYKCFERTTQLTRAASEHVEKRVRELVAAGAKLDIVDSAGWSALLWASSRGRGRIVKLLLDGKYEGKGADINLPTSGGDTALILASYLGHEAVVRLLLERGADVTLRGYGGRTALSWARHRNHAAIVALLKAHGARE